MDIHRTAAHPVPLPAAGATPIADAARDERSAARAATQDRADRVELSAEGADLAAKAATEAESAQAERLGRIRQLVDAGAYNDLAVAEAVARRLIYAGVV